MVHHYPRLVFGVAVGLVVALVPAFGDALQRLLIAWNAGVWTYVLSIGWLMFRARPNEVQAIAEKEDHSQRFVFGILSLASLLSLVAITVELVGAGRLPLGTRLYHYGFTLVTLLGSWLLLGIVFTIHYAHLYYRTGSQPRPLSFPGPREQPDYWDFLYFSFTISVAAQTSDVVVTSHLMRRVVLVHSVMAFVFNAAILGLTVNIAAGMLGK